MFLIASLLAGLLYLSGLSLLSPTGCLPLGCVSVLFLLVTHLRGKDGERSLEAVSVLEPRPEGQRTAVSHTLRHPVHNRVRREDPCVLPFPVCWD